MKVQEISRGKLIFLDKQSLVIEFRVFRLVTPVRKKTYMVNLNVIMHLATYQFFVWYFGLPL